MNTDGSTGGIITAVERFAPESTQVAAHVGAIGGERVGANAGQAQHDERPAEHSEGL